mmetsp:Transcript_29696/g.58173  ORF Transcript_29696/g.58173 Transcript_29696/m.58173 type:complete len:425 (+) Transcript_29696:58-1332(+)|eukprot:CAMPEP_0175148494 /NCGR_PEP_ID=MMETSP0087-20121206/16656_1 /TAXON_ID=136419 /ORGANISM="Unknown Unknown, Strain D1" /LENGTH=424 /DNA_ID=CAMNT_0016433955 /DNA_START=52 /DNA_END=1326 /DNA_ORIENTATION=+
MQLEFVAIALVSGVLATLNFSGSEVNLGKYSNFSRSMDDEIVRGVNIGGWLVLEPWITPSMFSQFSTSSGVADQWTFCQTLGKTEASKQLQAHWSSWFTEQDVIDIAAAGLTHIRVPVGYWLLGDVEAGEPWVTGDLPFLFAALDWANVHGLKVVVDLHCGPGSQNGFDNSGKKGAIHWDDKKYRSDGSFYYPNVDRTINVLVSFAQRFGDRLWALEVLNEPFISIDINLIHTFYQRAYDAVRAVKPTLRLMISDAFRFPDTNTWFQYPQYTGVYLDTHIYQVFDSYHLRMTEVQHLTQTCNQDRSNVANSDLWTITGEFSLATTDCAQWLNGFGTGARYDGSFPGSSFIGSCTNRDKPETFSQEYRNFLNQFAEKQMCAYETGNGKGWFFWNFKTEVAPQWNYLLGVQEGWIPKDPSQRQYNC